MPSIYSYFQSNVSPLNIANLVVVRLSTSNHVCWYKNRTLKSHRTRPHYLILKTILFLYFAILLLHKIGTSLIRKPELGLFGQREREITLLFTWNKGDFFFIVKCDSFISEPFYLCYFYRSGCLYSLGSD